MKNTIRITKTIIAVVLSILMIVGTMSVAFAAETDVASTGWNFGNNFYLHMYNVTDGGDWWNTAKFDNDGKLTVGLGANKTYKFLPTDGSNYFHNDGTMTKDNCTDWQFTANGNDPQITTDKEGSYTFVLKNNEPANADIKVSVLYPADKPAPTPSGKTMRLYFTNNQAWTTPYIYSWDSDSGYKWTGEWPGQAMTFSYINSDNQHVFYYDLPVEANRVIFNGTLPDGVTNQQTVTISENLEDNRGWYPESCTNNEWTVGTWAPVIAGDKYALTLDGHDFDFNGNYVSVGMTKSKPYTVSVKYTHNGVVTRYYLPEAISADEFVGRTLTKTDNSYMYTPTSGGRYGFTIDPVNMTLSCRNNPTRTFYFQDDTTTNWISNEDADMWITTDNGSNFTFMNESIDEYTGLKTWYAEVEEPAADTSIKFLRANRLFRSSSKPKADNTAWMKKEGVHLSTTKDADHNYNVWTATYSGNGVKNCYYRATDGDSETGNWVDGTAKCPDGFQGDYYWGIYCDTKGDGDTKDFVKMYTADKNTTNQRAVIYKLFLPSYVDLSKAKIYTTFYECKIQEQGTGSQIDIRRRAAGAVPNTLSLKNNTIYDVFYKNTSSEDTTRYLSLEVIKSEATASMLMNSNSDSLYTGLAANLKAKGWASDYKGAIVDKKGTYKFFDESGVQLNTNGTEIKKIKGRGNSSWEASMELYGKYAYNVNFSEKDKLIKGAVSSKKYCILANNMDESALRNTLIYSIGADVGGLYAPKTRLFDFFDKGNYLGSYVLVEKVEYGKNTLMVDGTNGAIKSMDSYNEDTATAEGTGIDYDNLTQVVGTYNGYKYQYNAYYDDNEVDIYDQALIGEDPSKPAFKKYDYVMEFELEERYEAEASWIEMKNGQHICMKYPEFASKSEMEWFIDEISGMYEAVYADNFATYSEKIDVNSFAKTYLIQELAQNLDSAATSYYITGGAHFDKLVAAPLWDYDWAVGDFYKTKMTTSGTMSMDKPDQLFVKDKSMRTGDKDTVKQDVPCFENALAHNEQFWNVCKDEWTNNFVSVLNKYIDNPSISGSGNDYTPSKKLLTDFMPKFESAQNMNEKRWHQMSDLLAGEGYGTSSMSWGTKSTSNYTPKSFDFNVGTGWASYYGSTTTMNYQNTVYYLNDWVAKRWDYMSSKLYDASLKYEIKDVAFTATQGTETDQDKLTITEITKTATVGSSQLSDDKITVNVYVNDEVVVTTTLDEFASTQPITLDAGENEVYVELIATDHPSTIAKSDSENYVNATPGGEVKLNIFFKSSSSYRYEPLVNGEEMEKDTLIGTNDSFTQQFYWYKSEVEAIIGENLTLNFKNSEAMDASITLTSVEYKDYYIGVDNLNNGKVAVDITNSPAKEFFSSAVHMISNNPNQVELVNGFTAYMNLNGTKRVLGDANSDNNLSIIDATRIQRDLAELSPLSEDESTLSDFNLDGNKDITDVSAIQKRIAKIS